MDCRALALTELPEGITTIETEAFSGCDSLALTHLPEGLTTIGDKAFWDTTPQVEKMVDEFCKTHVGVCD